VANIKSVADAKKNLSELMSRAAYNNERFLIQRRGKPMAALVSIEDLTRLEKEPVAPRRHWQNLRNWKAWLRRFTANVSKLKTGQSTWSNNVPLRHRYHKGNLKANSLPRSACQIGNYAF
tara:strand:+ start:81 stop:440 length:360 start_codon:yes stop_codon:yes gene_type:complete